MSKDERIYLRHMLDAARKVMAFTQQRQREDMESDEMLSLAVVRLLEILGEASPSGTLPRRLFPFLPLA